MQKPPARLEVGAGREDCSLLAQGSPEHSHCTFRVQEENLLGGLPKARSGSESMWWGDGGSRMGVCSAVSSSQLNAEICLGPGDCISDPHLNFSISELSPPNRLSVLFSFQPAGGLLLFLASSSCLSVMLISLFHLVSVCISLFLALSQG